MKSVFMDATKLTDNVKECKSVLLLPVSNIDYEMNAFNVKKQQRELSGA